MTATYPVLVDDVEAPYQHRGDLRPDDDDTAVFATALDSAGIRFYGARHENNAIAMAKGCAYPRRRSRRGSDRPRACHGERGSAPATYATGAGSRVLIISGEQAASSGAANALGPDYKGFNATGVLGAAGIRTFVATSPTTARGALADAAARGNAGRGSGVAAAGQRRTGLRWILLQAQPAPAPKRSQPRAPARAPRRRRSMQPSPSCGRAASR